MYDKIFCDLENEIQKKEKKMVQKIKMKKEC